MKLIPLIILLLNFTLLNAVSITYYDKDDEYKISKYINSDSGNFSYSNLNNVVFESPLIGFDLSNSNLINSDFGNREANDGISVNHVNFTNANLQNAYVPGHSSWYNNNFTNANLSGITFESYYSYHSLEGCDFTNADLRNANLSGTLVSIASGDSFIGLGDFIEPIFSNTLLYGAQLPGAMDENWNFIQLSQEWFEERGANFSPVPEPSTYALILGAVALGFTIRRRK